MQLITLLTDHGSRDAYIASVKGYLLSHLPEANIVDITHEIEPFSVGEAAFVLKNCYRDFPKGTVHLIGVEGDTIGKGEYLVLKAEGQFFLCQDNGLLSLVLAPEKIEEITSVSFDEGQLAFPLRNILAPAAVKLLGKGSAAGERKKEILQKSFMQPIIDQDMMRGSVIYIDQVGNAVTNIEKIVFESSSKGRNYRVFTSRREYMNKISSYYNEVPEGEKLCLFGSHGKLEIAINKGNASALLGLKLNSPILIEFE